MTREELIKKVKEYYELEEMLEDELSNWMNIWRPLEYEGKEGILERLAVKEYEFRVPLGIAVERFTFKVTALDKDSAYREAEKIFEDLAMKYYIDKGLPEDLIFVEEVFLEGD